MRRALEEVPSLFIGLGAHRDAPTSGSGAGSEIGLSGCGALVQVLPLMKRVIIHTDGGCKGNPGPGGFGVVMVCGKHRKELSGGYRLTTNNRMELRAAIAALQSLREPCAVELHSDSKYLIDAISKNWIEGWKKRGWKTAAKQAVKNQDLWLLLLAAMAGHKIDWRWVKGHAGHRENERCDELANIAVAGKNLQVDEGFTMEAGD